ncbi:hypothetical protein BH09PSE4_BH09PSE4_14590 [soil metagenome]
MKLSLILEAVDRMTAPIGKIVAANSRLRKSTDNAATGAARLAGRIELMKAVSYGAGFAIGALVRKVGSLALTGAGYGIAGITGLLGYLTVGVIRTGAKFEVFQAQLESVDGSATKARQSLAWVRKFAQETPYEIDDVTEAFVRARKAGIDPYNGGLEAMGDAAAGANKTLLDSIEAVADAQNYQYERLREFNITSSTKGGSVTFDYMTKAGKEATKTVAKSKAEVQHAIIDIYRDMYGGGMKLRSRTFSGILSNLKDTFTNFQFDISNGGFFDTIKAKLQFVLDWTNKMSANGKLKAWASTISRYLSNMVERAWKFATTIDWTAVAANLKLVGNAVWGIVKFLAKTVELVGKLDSLLRRLPQPPAWVKGANNWLGDKMTTPLNQLFSAPRPPSVKPAPQPHWATGNAKIALHVTTDRAVSVRPTQMVASGVDVQVNTGRAMAGFA